MSHTSARASESKLSHLAFALSLFGLFICFVGPIGFVLGIVSLVLERGKGPVSRYAIAAIIMPLVAAPVHTALFVNEVKRFNRRARQTECRTTLKLLRTAQQDYFDKHATYAARFNELAYTPDPGRHYVYRLGADTLASTRQVIDQTAVEAALEASHVVTTANASGFTAACVSNIDDDDDLDVWTVSNTHDAENVVDDLSRK